MTGGGAAQFWQQSALCVTAIVMGVSLLWTNTQIGTSRAFKSISFYGAWLAFAVAAVALGAATVGALR